MKLFPKGVTINSAGQIIVGSLILLGVFYVVHCDLLNHTGAVVNSVNNVPEGLEDMLSTQPLRFIVNRGQAGSIPKFHVQGAGHTVLFCENKVLLSRTESEDASNEITLRFDGANQNPVIEGINKLPGVANFYIGADPDQWRTNIPTYSSVIYKELYPGIDMAYIGNDGTLESEFYVSPGVDYHQIKLNYKGIVSKEISSNGSLVLKTKLGDLIEKPPYVYQELDGARQEVEADYTLLADGTIGFDLGEFNEDLPVVIDPELVFLTIIEGQIGGGEWASGVAMDSDNNVVAIGFASRNFPVTDTIQGSNHYDGLASGLLVKLDGNSGDVLYSALFGGTGIDNFNAIAIDSSDNIYITGETGSEDFPTLNAEQDSIVGKTDAFLIKFNALGELTFSTYIGGSDRDVSEGIALDGNGNIYIGGRTLSLDFPAINGFQTELSGEPDNFGDYPTDLFIAKYNANGSFNFATYLGGSDTENFGGIAADASGQVTIAGTTRSEDFPLANAFQSEYGGVLVNWGLGDMFISRLNSNGDSLKYSTYFGGESDDWATGIDLDLNGNASIAGGTKSEDFPVLEGGSFPEADSSDGVLIKLNNTGQPIYALRTNEPGNDSFNGVVVDDSNRVLPIGGEHLESIVIYEIAESEVVRSDFTFEELLVIEALGYAINHILYHSGYMLFASTVWGACGSSCRKAGVIKARIKDLFDITFEDGCLDITFRGPNDVGLTVSCDDNGFVTINGVPRDVKAADVSKVFVTGSEGDDEINLYQVDKEKFPKSSPISFPVQVRGKGGDDHIVGSGDKRSWLIGDAGKDKIEGGGGDDEIEGGEDDDTLDGGSGEDDISGDDGDDTIDGGHDDDKIYGGKGDDTIDGGSGDDDVRSGDGDDTINGGEGDDELKAGDGDDTIDGGKGDDFIDGGLGADKIKPDIDDAFVNAGPDNDILLFSKFLDGPNFNDPEYGTINTSKVNTSASTFNDTGGIDTLDFSKSGLKITLDISLLGSEQPIDTAGSQVILDGNFEVVLGSELNDDITLSPLVDTAIHIDGNDGMDTLNFEIEGAAPVDDGLTIRTPGYADVTYVNIETVNLPVASGIVNVATDITRIYNYPNPFISSTTFDLHLPKASEVKLNIYNGSGVLIHSLLNTQLAAGDHKVQWSADEIKGQAVGPGVYIYLFEAEGIMTSGKIVLMR